MDGTLVIFVGEAKNLPNIRKLEKQNPFCCLRFNKQDKKSEVVIRGGQRPQWNFEAHYESVGEDTNPILKISIFDKTKKGSHLICDCEINCSPVFEKKHKFDGWHDLSYANRRAGKVYIEMTFYPRYIKPQILNSPESIAAVSFHESRPLPRIPNTFDPEETLNESNNIHPVAKESAKVDQTHILLSSQNVSNSSLNSFVSYIPSSSNSSSGLNIHPEMHESGFSDNEHYSTTSFEKAKTKSYEYSDSYGGSNIDLLEFAKNSLSSGESLSGFNSISPFQSSSFGHSNYRMKEDDSMIRAFNGLAISQGQNEKKIMKRSSELSDVFKRTVEVPSSPFNPYKSTFSHSERGQKSDFIKDKENLKNEQNDESNLMRISAMLPQLSEFAASAQNEKFRSSMFSSVSSNGNRDSIFSTSIQSSLSSLPPKSLHYSSVDSPERFYPKFFLSSNLPVQEITNDNIDSINFQESISSLKFDRMAEQKSDIDIKLQDSILNKNYRPEEQKRRKEEVSDSEKEPTYNTNSVDIKTLHKSNRIQQESITNIPMMGFNNPYTGLPIMNKYSNQHLDQVGCIDNKKFGDEQEDFFEVKNGDQNDETIMNNNNLLENPYRSFDDEPYKLCDSVSSDANSPANKLCNFDSVDAATSDTDLLNNELIDNEVYDETEDDKENTGDYKTFIENSRFAKFSSGKQDINNIENNFAKSTSMFYKKNEPTACETIEPMYSQKTFFADLQPKPLIHHKVSQAPPIKSFNKKRLSKIQNCQ